MNKEQFKVLLEPIHKNHWGGAYKKLLRKISNLKANLIKRSQLYNVYVDISNEILKELFAKIYGCTCKYCEKTLTVYNIACDHIVPLSKGGNTTKENLQLICKTCNTRKSSLDEKSFIIILNWLSKQSDEIRNYLLMKMAKSSR